MAFSRYKSLIVGNDIKSFPKVNIDKRESDRFVIYDSNKTRLDRIAAEVYEDDTLYWVILLANPEYFVEFDIPNYTAIRVPFPINDVLQEVLDKVEKNQVH